jgi:hypothetical protein
MYSRKKNLVSVSGNGSEIKQKLRHMDLIRPHLDHVTVTLVLNGGLAIGGRCMSSRTS